MTNELGNRSPSVRVCFAIIAAVFVVMVWWSWGAWPDATVDFGRELYLTWRISEGDVLYRDLTYFDGPLSLLINGAFASIVGMSLSALVLKNLVVIAALTFGFFRLIERIADRVAALAACIIWLTTFAFARLLDVGNFNFVTPYTHLVVDGIALAVVALLALDRILRGAWRWGFALGVVLGAAFLGKADYFLALAVSIAVGFGAGFWAMPERRAALRMAGCAALATVPLVPLICFGWFARSMTASEALSAVLGSWPHVLGGASALPFYRGVLGVDRLETNLRLLLRTSLGWGVLFGALLIAYRYVRVPKKNLGIAGLIAFGIPFVVLGQLRWPELFRPLPLAMAVLFVACAERLLAARGQEHAPRATLRLAFVGWGCVLLAKVALNAKLRHYGFGLALPGMLAMTALLVTWMPSRLRGCALPGVVGRAAGAGVLAAVVVAHLLVTGYWYGELKTPIGEGADRFRAGASATPLDEALDFLSERYPGESLASYPDGAMLNYLARRRNPSGQTLAVPTAVALIGEGEIIRSLEAAPPDLIAIVHKNTSDEGPEYFGKDYAVELNGWIQSNYREVALFGHRPNGRSGFGIAILERRK